MHQFLAVSNLGYDLTAVGFVVVDQAPQSPLAATVRTPFVVKQDVATNPLHVGFSVR